MSKQQTDVRKVISVLMFLVFGIIYFLKGNKAKEVAAESAEPISQVQIDPVKPLKTETQELSIPAARQESLKPAEPKLPESAIAQNLGELKKREFFALSEKALKSIPTVQELRKLTQEQVHFTPEVVLNAGLEIGAAAEYLDKHPELSDDGLDFYEKCAMGASNPSSIRASCYFDFNKLAKKAGSRRSSPQVPEQVRNLADKLL